MSGSETGEHRRLTTAEVDATVEEKRARLGKGGCWYDTDIKDLIAAYDQEVTDNTAWQRARDVWLAETAVLRGRIAALEDERQRALLAAAEELLDSESHDWSLQGDEIIVTVEDDEEYYPNALSAVGALLGDSYTVKHAGETGDGRTMLTVSGLPLPPDQRRVLRQAAERAWTSSPAPVTVREGWPETASNEVDTQ